MLWATLPSSITEPLIGSGVGRALLFCSPHPSHPEQILIAALVKLGILLYASESLSVLGASEAPASEATEGLSAGAAVAAPAST